MCVCVSVCVIVKHPPLKTAFGIDFELWEEPKIDDYDDDDDNDEFSSFHRISKKIGTRGIIMKKRLILMMMMMIMITMMMMPS